MLPIPVLSNIPAAPGIPAVPGVTGIVPGAASAAVDFAALLPAGVAPVMPRQGDGESGSNLPATPGKDLAEGDDAAVAGWITPPVWLVTCPPPVQPGLEEMAPVAGAVVAQATIPQLTPATFAAPLLAADTPDPLPGLGQPLADVSSTSPEPYVSIAPAENSAPGEAVLHGDAVISAVVPNAAEVVSTIISAAATAPLATGPVSGEETAPVRSPALPVSALDPVVPGAASVSAEPVVASATGTRPATIVLPVGLPTTPQAADAAMPMMVQQGLAAANGADARAPVVSAASALPQPEVTTPASQTASERTGMAEPSGVTKSVLPQVQVPLIRGEVPAGTSAGKDRPVAPPTLPVTGGAVLQAAPAAPLIAAGQVAPAAQLFAAAIHRAVRDDRPANPAEVLIAGVVPTTDVAPHAVGAIEGMRHAALDMAHEAWPTKMIERIETLRDAMNAVDTSIRLVPDKLGTIDVTLRRDGDAVAVHFNAQQAETRQLLAEAQPKLAELAEAKGLKLSAQAAQGGHGGQGDGAQQHQHQRAPSSAPLSTNRAGRIAAQDDAAPTDERIA